MVELRFCPVCAHPLSLREAGGRVRLVCSAPECGWVHYDNPKPVVAAVVEHEDCVVLVRNHGWPDGWYGLVSGFLERGETPETAILRELSEELGLSGEVASFIGVYPFLERNELLVAYHVRAKGEIRAGPELAGHKLVPVGKLKPWPFGTGHAVRDWLERRAKGPGA